MVATETIWPICLKYLLSSPLQKVFVHPCLDYLLPTQAQSLESGDGWMSGEVRMRTHGLWPLDTLTRSRLDREKGKNQCCVGNQWCSLHLSKSSNFSETHFLHLQMWGTAGMFLGNWWEARRRYVDMTAWHLNEWGNEWMSEWIGEVGRWAGPCHTKSLALFWRHMRAFEVF